MSDKPREIWVLKTPGGEFIEYYEPMTMDWSRCSKIRYVVASAYEALKQMYDILLQRFDNVEKELIKERDEAIQRYKEYEHESETINEMRKERDEARAELRKFIQFDAFLKDDGSVGASVYESAVKGRQDFRKALKAERAKSAKLVEALQAIGNKNFVADREWAIKRANEALNSVSHSPVEASKKNANYQDDLTSGETLLNSMTESKCAACACGRKLEIAVEALKEIRAERKSFGACPSVANQALKKIAHFTAEGK